MSDNKAIVLVVALFFGFLIVQKVMNHIENKKKLEVMQTCLMQGISSEECGILSAKVK